jgi:ATP-dependent helicase HrpB
MAPVLPPLPIDLHLAAVRESLRAHGCLLLQAEPGAGKTTRVPPALLAEVTGEVWVVEPRRVAALLAARRVAFELGETPGQTVGYAVRFDEVSGPTTRLRFVTDGVFLRRLLQDPTLRGIGAVVLDELHERRLATDLSLALLRRLTLGTPACPALRPDLRLVAMSATLDADALSRYMNQARVLRVPGRQYPVAVEHAVTLDQRQLEDQVASTVRRLLDEGLAGDVLVFLPGAGEIRRCEQALRGLADRHDLDVRPLHGSLPLDEQERAMVQGPRRKVVLATNVAETSVTLPGVVAVVDAGLARVAGFAGWSGLPILQLTKISKASSAQRAGRAGRVGPGRCLRLYTVFDHDARPDAERPEVTRSDLSDVALQLAAMGLPIRSLDANFWLDPPPDSAVTGAHELLGLLGATLADGQVTQLGRQMLRLPLPPRLARLVVGAVDAGVGDDGCAVAALLSEREIRLPTQDLHRVAGHGRSDVHALLELYRKAESAGARGARDLGLEPVALRQAQRVERQLNGLARAWSKAAPPRPVNPGDALDVALLQAFPDRLARRRTARGPELELAGGTAVKLAPTSQATEPELLLVIDAEERRDGRGLTTWVRLASGLDASQVLDVFADRVEAVAEFSWNPTNQRVITSERLEFAGITLDATVRPARACTQASTVLREAAANAGPAAFADADALDRLRARVAFARSDGGLTDLPELDDVAVQAVLAGLCEDRCSFKDLREADLLGALRSHLACATHGRLQRLDETAPETVTLPGGRRTRVHYMNGQTPWISSRLQDFFGMAQGPRVAQGRVPLVVHLLAPNQRPVQVTTDLAGFWQRHYPALRKELGRRYPRHAWPEDPTRAEPPSAVSRPKTRDPGGPRAG